MAYVPGTQMGLMPQDDTAGLLGYDADAVRRNALLQMGLSMMANSGPSTTRRSLGQIIGQGGMAGMNAFQQGRQEALRRALLKRQFRRQDRQDQLAEERFDLQRQRFDAQMSAEPQPKTFEIGGAIVREQPDGTFKPVYTAEPQLPKAPTGYEWTANEQGEKVLAPIPGGPKDPNTKQDEGLSSEAANRYAQYQNALPAAQEYLSMVIKTDEDGNQYFDDVAARLPAAKRALTAAVRSKLRGESGATITQEEVSGEMEKYGPQLLSSDETNIRATMRLIEDLESQSATIKTGGIDTGREQGRSGGTFRTPSGATVTIQE